VALTIDLVTEGTEEQVMHKTWCKKLDCNLAIAESIKLVKSHSSNPKGFSLSGPNTSSLLLLLNEYY